MKNDLIITAIDLGTEKCVTLIAGMDQESHLMKILGVSVVSSRGVRKSMIVDLEEAVAAISDSLDGAERMAGFEVQSAFLSIAGAHIHSINSKGVVAVANPNQEIVEEDVERVIEAARAVSLPGDRQIIHIIPRYFKVDSQDDIRDPIGMTGVRLESEAHIITGMTTALKNIEKSVNDLGLTIDAFVFSGLAASEVVLSETEKELGVITVDIGAGSSSFCVFVDGALEFSGAIPLGARHITQDIALGCRLSLDAAEKIKLSLSSEEHALLIKPIPGESKDELNRRRKKADKLDLEGLGITESDEQLSKKVIIEGIMFPRMKEIFNIIAEKMQKKDLLGKVPAGVVLTGGGASTIGIVDVAKKVFRLPARVGIHKTIAGLTTDLQKPSFTNAVGLLVYGQKHGGGKGVKRSFNFNFISIKPIKQLFIGISQLIRKLLP